MAVTARTGVGQSELHEPHGVQLFAFTTAAVGQHRETDIQRSGIEFGGTRCTRPYERRPVPLHSTTPAAATLSTPFRPVESSRRRQRCGYIDRQNQASQQVPPGRDSDQQIQLLRERFQSSPHDDLARDRSADRESTRPVAPPRASGRRTRQLGPARRRPAIWPGVSLRSDPRLQKVPSALRPRAHDRQTSDLR